MKQAPVHFHELILPVVEGLGYECVGIEYNPHPKNGLLRIYIDKDGAIEIGDCSKVSHQVSAVLDVEDLIQDNYRLEVSSPGMQRPLFKVSDFQQFIGNKVKVNLFVPVNNRRKITGEIIAVVGDVVSVKEMDRLLDIPFNLISKACLITY